MIRRLSEPDRAAAVALLASVPALNLYLLGNLEVLGFEHEFCEFWGDFDRNGELRGLVNRYMTGWAVFGRPDTDWRALAAVIDGHPVDANRLQDNPGGVASILPYLQRYAATRVNEEELMTLAAGDFRPQPTPDGILVRRGALADLDALASFYADAGHMTRTRAGVERPLRDTRLWLAERAGEIVAAALTNAETRDRAMIGGVYTPPPWRGRGLSQAVCSALCRDLLEEHKQPVLYWDTPAAGAVYRKLGFHAAGWWRSVWIRRD